MSEHDEFRMPLADAPLQVVRPAAATRQQATDLEELEALLADKSLTAERDIIEAEEPAAAAGEPLVERLRRVKPTHSGDCSIEDEEHERRMALARSKPKPTTGGAYGRDGNFAQAHLEVFGSPQFRALGHWTKLLLQHVNLHAFGSNGFIALSFSKLSAEGFYRDSLRKAIREALETGFLRCTRQARPAQRGAGRVPAYYFPTWLRRPGEAEPPDTWAKREPVACKDTLKAKRKLRTARMEQFFEKTAA